MWFTLLQSCIFIFFAFLIGINMIGIIRLKYKKDFDSGFNFSHEESIKKKTRIVILSFILLVLIMVITFLLQANL